MARRLLTASATLSSGSNWLYVDSSNLGTSNTKDDLNTPRNKDLTFNHAANCMGVFIEVQTTNGYLANTDNTVTVKLQENTGSWVDRATGTAVFNNTTLKYGILAVYIPFSASYAVTTAPATWRIQVSNDVAGGLSWHYDGTSYFYAIATDYSTAKPASGDNIVTAQNANLTIDENASWVCTNYLGTDSYILAAGTSANTLTLTGSGVAFVTPLSGGLTLGSDGSPVSRANRLTIDMSAVTSGYLQVGWDYWFIYDGSNPVRHKGSLKLWGAENEYLSARVASDANSGQAVVVLDTDTSAIWSNSDVLTCLGKTTSSHDTVTYTRSSQSGTSLTLSANLDYKLLAGGAVLNRTQAEDTLGIKIIGNPSSITNLTVGEGRFEAIDIVGVYFVDFNISSGTTSILSTVVRHQFRSIMADATNESSISACDLVFGTGVSADYDNIHRFKGADTYPRACISISGGKNHTANRLTVKNDTAEGYGGIRFYGFSGLTGSKIVSSGHLSWYFGQPSIFVNGVNAFALTDVFGYGGREALLLYGVAGTVDDSKFNGAVGGSGYNVRFVTSAIDIAFNGCSIGEATTAGTKDVGGYGGPFVRATFTDCGVGSTGYLAVKDSDFVTGSSIKVHNYDNTANDHRTYNTFGNTQSTGDGLSDTTVNTSGTGKFAIRFEPTSSTNNLEWSFTIPTGDISTKTMTLFAWVKINHANYYAGTYQLPRMTIDYDNGTEAYAEATATTSWQLLTKSFTPTTNYGEITVTYSARTDETSTDSYVYFDDFGVSYPPSVTLDLGGLDNWANALPVTPPIALPISAGTVAQAVALLVPGEIKYIDGGEIPLY